MLVRIDYEGVYFNMNHITIIDPEDKWFRIGRDGPAINCSEEEINIIIRHMEIAR